MNTTKILLGVLAGAAAGVALGILFAPDKGSSTRKTITNKSDDLVDDLKQTISDGMNTITGKLEDIASGTKGLVEKGKSKIDTAYNHFKNADHHDKFLPKADLNL